MSRARSLAAPALALALLAQSLSAQPAPPPWPSLGGGAGMSGASDATLPDLSAWGEGYDTVWTTGGGAAAPHAPAIAVGAEAVYAVAGGGAGGAPAALVARAAATGALVWRAELADLVHGPPAASNPALAADGGAVFVAAARAEAPAAGANVFALNASSGALLWASAPLAANAAPAPMLITATAGGRVLYVEAGEGAPGSPRGALVCLDARARGALAWRAAPGLAPAGSPLAGVVAFSPLPPAADGRGALYLHCEIASGLLQVCVVDEATGALLRVLGLLDVAPPYEDRLRASFMLAASRDGRWVLSTGDYGSVWAFSLGDACAAPPAPPARACAGVRLPTSDLIAVLAPLAVSDAGVAYVVGAEADGHATLALAIQLGPSPAVIETLLLAAPSTDERGARFAAPSIDARGTVALASADAGGRLNVTLWSVAVGLRAELWVSGLAGASAALGHGGRAHAGFTVALSPLGGGAAFVSAGALARLAPLPPGAAARARWAAGADIVMLTIGFLAILRLSRLHRALFLEHSVCITRAVFASGLASVANRAGVLNAHAAAFVFMAAPLLANAVIARRAPPAPSRAGAEARCATPACRRGARRASGPP